MSTQDNVHTGRIGDGKVAYTVLQRQLWNRRPETGATLGATEAPYIIKAKLALRGEPVFQLALIPRCCGTSEA